MRDIDDVKARLEENTDVIDLKQTSHGLEVRIEMPNPAWGLPNEIYETIKHADVNLVDFSGVTEDRITIYIE